MIGITLMCAMVLGQAPPRLNVSVETLSGPQRTGTVVELTTERVTIESDGDRTTLNLRDLLALIVNDRPPANPPAAAAWIELVDGSQLEATRYTVQNRIASLQIGDRAVSLDARNIRSVRFHPPSPALDRQWREIVAGANHGDVAVLRRSKTSLDQLEGVFHDVTDEAVDFEYDEQRIAVKQAKLEGIVYFHPVARDLPKTVCDVLETGGSLWRAQSLELAGEILRLTTTGGTDCELPVEQLARLDFAAGNVTYLSDLEFELVECTPFIATRLPAKRILQLYQPRRDASFEGSGLWLGDSNNLQQYEKGLSIHSRSLLVFRLNEPYRKLTAVAGIDNRLRGHGNVLLVIQGDGRELVRQTISGKDPPVALDVNIEDVRRLEILVDFGETLDVADHLNLGNARIIK
ncbi:MAG: NPCBM/NEW2 domain-containing protein [Pirellulaceae bacterium]